MPSACSPLAVGTSMMMVETPLTASSTARIGLVVRDARGDDALDFLRRCRATLRETAHFGRDAGMIAPQGCGASSRMAYCALHPPSICNAEPRISLAASEHRNTAMSPICCGVTN